MTKYFQKIIFSMTSFTLLFSGCFPKRYVPDVYEVPTDSLQNSTALALDNAPFVPGSWPNARWWHMLEDCQLNELINKALKDNPDLKMAKAKVRLSFHQAGAAGSPLFPMIGLESDITRYRISKTGAISGFTNSLGNQITTPNQGTLPAPIGPPGFTFTQEEININGNYQFDFWQKNLNYFKSAVSEVLAREADLAFSTVLLSTNVALSYFNYQIAQAREIIAIKRIENRNKYLKLIEKRLKNDLDNQLTLKTAQSYVIGANEALTEVEHTKELFKNQISALIAGNFDEIIESVSIEYKELTPLPLPTDLPLDLLSHRPDVTATAWRVEEAAKLIKVAKTAYYPNFNIAGLFGFQTIHPQELFKWHSIYGQVGPAVNLPLFEGGLLYANLGEAYENYNIAVEQYNKTVIQAVQNVLDSFSGLKFVFKELDDYNKIVDLSKQSLNLVEKRFQNQIDSYINVLDAELDYISKEDQRLITLADYYQKFINMISALGGGYEE